MVHSVTRPSGGSGSESSSSEVFGEKSSIGGSTSGSADSGSAWGSPSSPNTIGNGSPQ